MLVRSKPKFCYGAYKKPINKVVHTILLMVKRILKKPVGQFTDGLTTQCKLAFNYQTNTSQL